MHEIQAPSCHLLTSILYQLPCCEVSLNVYLGSKSTTLPWASGPFYVLLPFLDTAFLLVSISWVSSKATPPAGLPWPPRSAILHPEWAYNAWADCSYIILIIYWWILSINSSSLQKKFLFFFFHKIDISKSLRIPISYVNYKHKFKLIRSVVLLYIKAFVTLSFLFYCYIF